MSGVAGAQQPELKVTRKALANAPLKQTQVQLILGVLL